MAVRDYRFITYWIAPDATMWCGPFCPEDNVHWKKVYSDIVSHSELPPHCVEITPLQAAKILELNNK